jgi:hypothetical protein
MDWENNSLPPPFLEIEIRLDLKPFCCLPNPVTKSSASEKFRGPWTATADFAAAALIWADLRHCRSSHRITIPVGGLDPAAHPPCLCTSGQQRDAVCSCVPPVRARMMHSLSGYIFNGYLKQDKTINCYDGQKHVLIEII